MKLPVPACGVAGAAIPLKVTLLTVTPPPSSTFSTSCVGVMEVFTFNWACSSTAGMIAMNASEARKVIVEG